MKREINPRLELLFGASVRFRDGLHGRLTGICLDSESHTLTGIGVSEHPNGEQFYVPIDLVTAGFSDCVHLNQRRDSTISKPGPRRAWLTPDQPVRWAGPDRIGARLNGVIADHKTARLQTLVIAGGRRESLLGLAADRVKEIPNAVVAVRQGTTLWNELPEYCVDEDASEHTLEEAGREGPASAPKTAVLPTDVTKRRRV